MRLFIAIGLPETVREKLAYAAESLGQQAESARVVSEENFHITLVFIGETRRVDEVQRLMHTVCVTRCDEPFNITISGIGSFRQGKTHRYTWWAGIEAPLELYQLEAALSDALRTEGFAIEKRSYRPHITLARGVCVNRPIELAIPTLEVRTNRISLMRSERINNHMVYTEIAQA
ncbi:MAG: RNA 2',3'-cyclic phosphodiesterase [Coriobacteriales bacterium]|jgi:2'-5' RNA ligase|nr:RNA 2',3'-cyclic phosphodiesterase [Coriobacteriales bacterium]